MNRAVSGQIGESGGVVPPRSLGGVLAAAALVVMACVGSGQTQADDADCLMCHESLTGEDGQPLGDLAAIPESLHGEMGLGCTDCHVDLAGAELPHAEQVAPASCAVCHGDVVDAVAGGAHAVTGANSCVSCHGAHDIRAVADPASGLGHFQVATVCAACHDGDDAETASFADSIHGHALNKSGLNVAPNCVTCHGAHGVLPADDERSRIHRSAIPENCGSCHEGILPTFRASVHGTHALYGDRPAAICSDCHQSHSIRRADLADWQHDVIQECGTCHEESLHSYEDTFHGQVTALGFERVAKCADCHGAHDIRSVDSTASRVVGYNLLETCRSCHPHATSWYVQYSPHPHPENREKNPALFWTGNLMKLLLASVFAFFFVHTSLWLPREIVERRQRRKGRRSAGNPPSDAGAKASSAPPEGDDAGGPAGTDRAGDDSEGNG